MAGEGARRVARPPAAARPSSASRRIAFPPSAAQHQEVSDLLPPRPDQLAARLGAALSDRYVIESELPRVGTARIFRATETGLGRSIVLKVLPTEVVSGLELDRFRREVQLAASIPHPHIVPILAAGELNGLPWYAMPFIDGESLGTRLKRLSRFPATDVFRVLREVTTALVAAHARGVVHRDIKPDNILFAGDVAMVADFGVAKALRKTSRADDKSMLTRSGFIVGTPAYMAPEQAAGDAQMDGRVDIYALGCVAFEMLTGHPPYAARTIPALLAAQVTTPVPDVAQHADDVPPELALLITRCLAKAPEDRPSSATVLLRELDAIRSTATESREVTPRSLNSVDAQSRGHAEAPADGTPNAMLRHVLVAAGAVVAIGIVVWLMT